MGIEDRATARFAALRRQALDELSAGRLLPGPHPPPDGWCVSTVVRLVNDGPGVVAAVRHLQQRLDDTGSWAHYAPESLHVSLLGCTRREVACQAGQLDRLAAIRASVADVVAAEAPVTVALGRLGLLGAQAFVEVVPVDERWAALRRRLGDALTRLGESPMTHPDAEPIHLNISRLAGAYDTRALTALLADDRSTTRPIHLATIELVVTDFALTPANTTFVATFRSAAG
jgi:hypothetical protein